MQREQQQKTGTRERSSTAIRTDTLCSNTTVTGSSVITENISNIDSVCEIVEPLGSTKSYSISSKENQMYQVSCSNAQESRIKNELFLSTSLKNEIKSTVTALAVSDDLDNNSERSTGGSNLFNKNECVRHEDVEMRIIEEEDNAHSEPTIIRNLEDIARYVCFMYF